MEWIALALGLLGIIGIWEAEKRKRAIRKRKYREMKTLDTL